MNDLFHDQADDLPTRVALGAQAWWLRGFAQAVDSVLLADVASIATVAPFRHLVTPTGHTMSVAMTNCGKLGWTSDRRGYRYTTHDPAGGAPWPAMPASFQTLARDAAIAAGFADFAPDACLVNRYVPGARLTLHQDRNELSDTAPIVSVSLGLPATFQFGGHARTGGTQRIELRHGDVVVWGGVDRMRFHGVLPLKDGLHPQLGATRINLTFRTAGAA